MAKFKVIVQVYKEFRFDAATQEEAMKMADEAMQKFPGERYNINMATNLDKKKERKAKSKSKSQEKREAVVQEGAAVQPAQPEQPK